MTTLFTDLAKAISEEDVKDAYIKSLSLKNYTKGSVDIKTAEMWFEAKESATASDLMFAQLLVYVNVAKTTGKPVPAFLAAVDRVKGALVDLTLIDAVFDDTTIKWPKAASVLTKSFVQSVKPYLADQYVEYNISSHEEGFIRACTGAIKNGVIPKTPVTPNNLKQIFDRWSQSIGAELGPVKETDYAVLFLADLMHDGTNTAIQNLPARLLYDSDTPVFILNRETYDVANPKVYRNFWRIYDRPPAKEHRHYLLERKDSLLPVNEQKFKGRFYTPLNIVDLAYDQLSSTLGDNWQEEYIVWDMCCGLGNLEVKHSNYRNVYMSTIDETDIKLITANRTCPGADAFQYDYLNDDVNDFGKLDYSLTGKLPKSLRKAIEDSKNGVAGTKKLLVLINPPYGEAANTLGNAGKSGIARTRISYSMEGMGYAARELFVQFITRIQHEMPNAVLAMFSTLKYINAPNFEHFRREWTPDYLGGFLVHSRAFDGLTGNFPIGFLIWDLSTKNKATTINAVTVDRHGAEIGIKQIIDAPNSRMLSGWIERMKTSTTSVPLKNAITPQDGHAKVSRWTPSAIGYLYCNSNDLQNAGTKTAILSSVYSAGNGYYITRDNIDKVAIVFSVRMVVSHTWQNHNDQFLIPAKPVPSSFKADCLIYMLFAGKNLSSGVSGLSWGGKSWELVNHFIPFTEKEVSAAGKFESDFMSKYVKQQRLSKEAQAVLEEGRKLWCRFFSLKMPGLIKAKFGLNRADAGWYQIRKALGEHPSFDRSEFDDFQKAYAALSDKIRSNVTKLGFLPR